MGAAENLSLQPETVSERFLLTIAGKSLVTFQTFDDTTAKRRNLSQIVHGWTQFNAARLRALNDKGAGVFYMVNQGDGTGRSATNVTGVRALFVDLDGAPLEPVLEAPLRPHIAVQSSPGKYHAYWLVHGVRLDEFTDLQRHLAEKFDGDASVIDLPRVMRVPGFMHQKGAPHLSTLIHANAGKFDRDTFLREFQITERKIIVPKTATTDRIPEGKRTVELLKRARGFVNKGLQPIAVNKRVQALNASYCDPPLCATEVDAIVSSACGHPSKASIELPAALFDSPTYRAMSDAEFRLCAYAMRQLHGGMNGNISLAWEDYRDLFPGNKKFYRIRNRLAARLLEVTRASRNLKSGKTPTLYRIKLP